MITTEPKENTLRSRLVVSVSVAFLLLWPASSLARSASRSVTADTVAGGLNLRLSLPRDVYPLHALVRATIRVQNVSNQSVPLPSPCPPGVLFAEVIASGDRIAYPPALRSELPANCPPPPPRPTAVAELPPGGVAHVKILVILRASHLRAVASMGPPGGVTGRFLRIRLIHGETPRVQLRRAPLEALVRSRTPAQRGPLYYDAWAICQEPGATGPVYHGAETGWHVVRYHSPGGYLPRPQLQAGQECSQPVQWHLVAGFLNQPVACVDYVSPSLPAWMRSSVTRACAVGEPGT